MADALRDTPDKAQAAIEGVAQLSAMAAKRTDQMRALLDFSEKVTGDLARNSQEILDLMKQSTLVLEELTKRRDAIRAMLVDSKRLAREIFAGKLAVEDVPEPTILNDHDIILEVGLIATLQAFIFATLTSIYFGEASAGGH